MGQLILLDWNFDILVQNRNNCYKGYLQWQNYSQESQLIPSSVVVVPVLEV
jgi:hypothetical protein